MNKNLTVIAIGALFLVGNAAADSGANGKALYETTCNVCHSLGVAGAPQFGDADAWKQRLNERGLEGVKQNALTGINSMPAKGTCTACSDQEIFDAIDYMIKSSVE